MRLNLRQVEAFRAVSLTGSMTAAGEMMGVTQPAVSRLIKDLEAELGIRLFDRRGAQITPTPDAVRLFQEVQRSFHGLDRIARAAEEIVRTRSGTLRVAATMAASLSGLPSVITAFRAAWPGVDLSLETVSSPEVVDLLAMPPYDLGVAVLPAEGPGVEIEALPPLNAPCVMPTGHRLAGLEVVRPTDLAGETLLQLTGNSLVQIRLRRLLEEAGVDVQGGFETSFSATLCALVARGLGVAVIDPLTARTFAGHGIEVRPFAPAVPYELKLVFNAHRPRTAPAEAFGALLHKHLAELAADG